MSFCSVLGLYDGCFNKNIINLFKKEIIFMIFFYIFGVLTTITFETDILTPGDGTDWPVDKNDISVTPRYTLNIDAWVG